MIYDVNGRGFGSFHLPLAIALEEHQENAAEHLLTAAFFEWQSAFW